MSEQLVPQTRFAGFDGEWVQGELGEVTTVLGHNNLSRADLTYGPMGVGNIHYGDVLIKFGSVLDAFDPSLPKVKNPTKLGNLSRFALREGDVIFADAAEDRTVGKCTELRNVQGRRLVSGLHTIPLRPSGVFGEGFLGYALGAPCFHDQLIPKMQGTKVLSLTAANLRESRFSWPHFDEQKAIGSLFTDLDASIDQHRRKHQQLKQTKASLLERMFPAPGKTVPQVRFDGFEGEWAEREVGSLGSFLKGSGYSKADVGSGQIPLFLYGRLYTNYQLAVEKVNTFTAPRPNSVVSRGDEVLVPSSGETPEDIAVACALLESGVLLGGDLNVIRPNAQTDSIFLALSLSHGVAKDALSKRAQGKSVVHLHNSDLRALTIYLPSSSEQRAIGAFFAKLDALIDAEQHRVEKLQQVKASLLKKMFV